MDQPPKKTKTEGGGYLDTHGAMLLAFAETQAQHLFTHLHPGGDQSKFCQDALDIPKKLVFTFMDIGQGNATLIECPGGELILIDCGSVTSENGKLISCAKEFIRSKAKNKHLDYLVISHPDKDHINEVHEVLEGMTIGKVLIGGTAGQWKTNDNKPQSGIPKKTFKKFIEQVKGQPFEQFLVGGGNVYTEAPDSAASSRQIQCSAGLDAWIVVANADTTSSTEIKQTLGPTNVDTVKPGTHANTSCVVVMFCYQKTKVLICSDATFATESYIINNTAWKGHLESYALEGGHHGSADSFSDGFLQAVNPSWIHFSADNKDTFRHPTWEVVSRVISNCPQIKAERSFGPHGIVSGPKKNLLDKQLAFIETTPRIKQVLEVMSTEKCSGADAMKTCYALWLKEQQAHFGKSASEMPPLDIWVSDLFIGGRKEKRLANLLTYWGVWFDNFAREYQRLNSLTFGSGEAYWEWLLTDYNLFTTLTTANDGVYWELTIDGYGEAITERL